MPSRLRSALVPFAICLCMTLYSCKPKVSPFGKTVEEEVRDSLDLKKFDKSKLDEHAVVLVASKSGRRIFSRDDIEAFIAHTREKNESYVASDFKVLDKSESDNSPFA